MDLEAEVPQSIARRLKLHTFAAAGTSLAADAYQESGEVT
jgi:hypothetical protein